MRGSQSVGGASQNQSVHILANRVQWHHTDQQAPFLPSQQLNKPLHHQQRELLIDGRMDLYFHVV